MSVNIYSRKFLFLILGIFFFTLITKVDFHSITPQNIILFHECSAKEIDVEHLELYQIFGYTIAGFIMIIFNTISNKKALLLSVLAFAISIVCSKTSMMDSLFPVVLIVMSGSAFCYFIINIIHIIEYFKYSSGHSFTIIFALLVVGSLCGDKLASFFDEHNLLLSILLNIVFLSFVIISIHFYSDPTYTEILDANFSSLIAHTNLQTIAGFVIFYIIASIFWYHYTLDAEHDAIVLDLWILRKYILITALVCAVPMQYLVSRFSKYRLNLLFLLILIISFISLLSPYTDALIHLSLLGVISICLYALLLCNFLILVDKFENKQRHNALVLYFTMGAVGYYAGAIVTDKIIDILGGAGLISSIGIVLISYTFYYLLQFIKCRLYKW